MSRYPYHSAAVKPLAQSAPARSNPYSMVISEDILYSRAAVQPSNIKVRQNQGIFAVFMRNIYCNLYEI